MVKITFCPVSRCLRVSAALLMSVQLLGKSNADLPPATTPIVTNPGPRYVLCEAYPFGPQTPKGEKTTSPWYKDFCYSTGSNIPTRYLPEYFRFTKDPMGLARYDIQLAKEAGIDAFCFGDTAYGGGSQFSETFWDYWKVAQKDGRFKLVPYTLLLNKENGQPGRVASFQSAWNMLTASYRDTFLQIDGKYVMHDWTADPSKATTLASNDEMNAVFAPLGGLNKVYLIEQTTYLGSMTPVDGHAQNENQTVDQYKDAVRKYASGFTQFQAESYGDLPTASQALAKVTKELGKELIYPVMQSFYQSRWQFNVASWGGGRLREKLGFAGCYYQWRNAIDSKARIAYITTWNDVTEDHSVMPEELHGYAYYELTKYFIKWFKTGARPPVENEQILMFHHPQLTEKPLQVPPGGLLAGCYSGSATPPTDYVGVVVMLKNPAKVTLEMGISSTGVPNTEIASRDFPAGTNFWLIYHPLENVSESAIPDVGDHRAFSKNIPVYPQERDDFFVTKLDRGFEDREVFLSVDRGSQNVGYFTSHQSIVGAAAAGNLGTVGDVFELK